MAVELATAYVQIVPSARGLQGRLRSEVGGPLSRAGDAAGATAGKRYSSKFATAAKVGMLGAAGLVVGALAAVFKTGFNETKDASAGTAQLNAGIKSTGNAAGVSVKGMNDLASSIQGFSGQTDDSIVAAESLLLTFTSIKQNGPDKIFDKATLATADMAAKMGGDASSNAILLGKALNDPVKGITALTRVGVSFSDGQKTSIKAMVDAGDTAGAQKIILKELSTEFGGAAKAAGQSLPGQMARAKRAFEDVSQNVVTALMPAITGVLRFILDKLMPGFQRLVDWVQSKWPTIKAVIVGVWNGYIKPALSAMVGFFRERILPAIQAVVRWVAAHWPQIQAAFMNVWNAVKPVLAAWVNFLFTKVYPAIGAVVRWVVAHWPQIQAVFKAVWDAVKPVLASFMGVVMSLWKSVLEPIVRWIQGHWSAIQTAMKVVFVVVAVAAKVFLVVLKFVFDVLATVIRVLASVFRVVFNTIGAIIRGAVAVIRGIINIAIGIFRGFQTAVRAIVGTVRTVISDVVGFIQKLPGRIVAIFAGAARLLLGAGKAILRGLWDGIKFIWETVLKGANGIAHIGTWFVGLFSKAGGWLLNAGKHILSGLWDGLKHMWDTVVGWFKKLPGWIMDALHINSPPQWAIDAGSWMMKGVIKGIVGGAADFPHFLAHYAALAARKVKEVAGAVGKAVSIGGNINELFGKQDMWIVQAMMAVNKTVPGSLAEYWLPAIKRRIMYESGGNPNAINRTDQNAAAGHPSKGLMQTIDSTFNAYRLPNLSSNVYDPVANIAAAIRYILANYGDISRIDPPTSGYASGAWNLRSNQLAYLHKGEMIIPANDADKIRAGGGGGGPVQISGRLTLDDDGGGFLVGTLTDLHSRLTYG